MSPTLAALLKKYGQEHLLQGWDQLPSNRREQFQQELAALDLELLATLRGAAEPEGEFPRQRAQRAQPPSQLVRLPRSDSDRAKWQRAHKRGEEVLARGQAGAILVAGGQGTRLGSDRPKGMFPIGPVSGKSLFQMLAEQLLARSRRADAAIPYYIMTSDATHDETVAFFQEHGFFGLYPGDVHFFRQGNMPAVEASTGKLLLAGPGELATSPDGHGGLLTALDRAGLLNDMRDRGVEYLYYHQVDNPLAIVCDPAFLGFHVLRNADVSTKVVPKTGPAEKMGLLIDLDGRTQIIEYSDLPAEVAERRTPGGELELWAGSTAIHVFSRSFLDRLSRERTTLPFHRALKAVPHCDGEGNLVKPEQENAYKFERFIFDVMLYTDRALVVEADRDREFNPVKNRTGVNSPDDVKQSLIRLHTEWMAAAGVSAGTQPVEISPLFALDATDVTTQLRQNQPKLEGLANGPVYLDS